MKSLPPDIEALLDGERQAAAPPDGARERVQQRLAISLGLAAGVAATTAAAQASAASAAKAGASSAAQAGASSAAQAGAVKAGAAAASKVLALKLVLGVVGAGMVGGGAYVAMQQKSAPAPMVALPTLDEGPPEQRPPHVTAPVVVPTVAPAPRRTRVARGLADEQAFLEEARAALRGGATQRALQLLSQHEREFPSGQLGDARESLAIQALVAEGRTADARSRAAEFRRRYPRSLFLPAVDASLGR